VRKALEALDGVEEAVTNFANGTAKIRYESQKLSPTQLKKAIDDAGYEGIIIEAGQDAHSIEESAKKNEISVLKRKLFLATLFVIPILYLAMADLISMSLIPKIIQPDIYPLRFALLQIILSLPIVVAGYRFYTVGFKNLFSGRPNMDSLIALGTLAAYIYGLYATFMIFL